MRSNEPNIYKIVNLVNGKVYIGQSSYKDDKYFGSGVVITEELKKIGKHNFKKEYLCFCEKEDLNDLEDKYIEQYKSYMFEFGYNIQRKGNKGKYVNAGKRVFVYNFNGENIDSFIGVKRKARELKINPEAILRVLCGKRFHYKSKIYSYTKLTKREVANTVFIMKNNTEKKYESKRIRKSIIYKNIKNGEEKKEFTFITALSKKLNIGRADIRNCLNKKRFSAGGYVFKYEYEKDIDLREEKNIKRYGKRYIGIRKNGEIVKFSNITKFSEENKINRRKLNSIILKEYKGTKINGWKDFYEEKN